MKLPFDKLIPPDDPVRSWRWLVAICVFFLLVHAGVSRGVMFGGIGAFAYASDVRENGIKMDDMRLMQISSALRELKKEECRTNGNKAFFQRTIEEYQLKYISIAKVRYPLPPCERG